MPSRLARLVLTLSSITAVPAEVQAIAVPNASFEEGTEAWSIPEGGMATVTDEQAATGDYSLKILDADGDQGGSNVTSARVPVQTPGPYELRWQTYPVTGSGCGIYVRVLREDGKSLVRGDRYQRAAPAEPVGEWVPASLPVYVPPNARYLEVWIHSYSHAVVTCYLDDLEFVPVEEFKVKLPWEPSYKVRPDDKQRLTPADFPGPDGIVYPDWTYAGVPGGIPGVPEAARIEDFGGRADDDRDDAAALEAACVAVGEQGGGAVVLGDGTYHLDRPVAIYHDSVVIRGRGPRQTRLVFRYALPPQGIAFYRPEPGATVGPTTQIEVHTRPDGLLGWRLEVDGTEVASAERGQHWGSTFQIRVRGSSIIDRKVADGPHTIKVIARYKTGDLQGTLPIVFDSKTDVPVPPEDTAHGPNGPRNVVYNCDISSPKTGLWMGGMNENWLILHNRFVVGKGPAIYAKDFSFDHTIRGNVFVVQDEGQPAVHLATPDCVGVELTGNALYGANGQLLGGAPNGVTEAGNAVRPVGTPDRPAPEVPSIFEWQREQRGRGRRHS